MALGRNVERLGPNSSGVAAAFAGGVCVVMMSPEMGDDRQLILDFDELCAVHEQRCLGGKGESTPLLSDGGEKKH